MSFFQDQALEMVSRLLRSSSIIATPLRSISSNTAIWLDALLVRLLNGAKMTEGSDSPPRLLGIILCERILQDVLRRDAVSCINIYNGISARKFPAEIPLVYAFAQVSGTTGQFNYQFRVEDGLGKLIACSPLATVEPLPNLYMTHKIVSAFSGLTFDSEGMYHVVLEIEGESVGSLPFQVLLVRPEVIA